LTTNKPFEWPVRVYYEDTDAQAVVYYANYFRFMERARTEWLRALGVDQAAMMQEQRRIFVVTETGAQFLRPAKLNDQLIVTASLASLNRATFEINQDIYRNSLNGELLVRGNVKAAYIDVDTMKPKRVPPTLFEENPT
jgi:acyl-CoA thioester hydrolase